jgi:hypothetical protein
MNLFKKLFIPSGEKKEITTFENWSVRWLSRNGQYGGDTQKEAEFFTNKDDAEKFANELRDAFKLIKHTSGTKVDVMKT